MTSSRASKLVLATALVLAVAPPAAAGGGALPAAPGPHVIPAPAGDHGFPFLSEAAEIAPRGYVEQEFLVSGTATAYAKDGAFGSDGRWKVQPASTAPYTTRILVRRPSDPRRFNGTVVVEWFNVTGGVDAPADWVTTKDELLRAGYAYVGVSAQRVGIDGGIPGFPALKGWDPGRYGTLAHPGDRYSYDIFSQAGRALRASDGPRPLGPLRPRRILAVGESQSAVRMTTYVDAVAPAARVYDGYLIHSNFAVGAPLDDFPGDVTMPNPTTIRTDLGVPTFVVGTETDVLLHLAARQPDSATVHSWELAGTSHADRWLLDTIAPTMRRMYGTEVPSPGCGATAPINDGPGRFGVSAALRALDRWVRTGRRPSAAPPVVVSGGRIVRDPATGLALGGVRLPDITVPTRTLTGERNTANPAGALCFLFGATDPWNGGADSWDVHTPDDPSDPTGTQAPEPDLAKLYPSHRRYLARVAVEALRAVRHGYLTPGDATTIVRTARTSPIGR